MLPMVLVVLLFLGAVGIYFFFAVCRAVSLFCRKGSRRRRLLLSVGVTVVMLLLLWLMFGSLIAMVITVLHLTVFLAVSQLVDLLVRRVAKCSSRKWELVYRLGALPVLCVTVLFVCGYFNMQNVLQTEYTVKTDKPLGERYRIAVLADIHYGTSVDAEAMEQVVSNVNAQRPDAVILCGDLVDETTTHGQMRELFVSLSGLKPRLGVYYVFGNHDRSAYAAAPNYTVSDLQLAAEEAGIVLLQDETVSLGENFVLVGRKDRSMGRAELDSLLADVAEDSFVLLADHQPTDFAQKAAAGVELTVSGHTHGGQLFPLGYLNTWISDNDLCYGRTQVGNMTALVTSGVSSWGFPIRTQSCSEYLLITIAP